MSVGKCLSVPQSRTVVFKGQLRLPVNTHSRHGNYFHFSSEGVRAVSLKAAEVVDIDTVMKLGRMKW